MTDVDAICKRLAKEAFSAYRMAPDESSLDEVLDGMALAMANAGLRGAVQALEIVASTCGTEADETYWVGHSASLKVHDAIAALRGDDMSAAIRADDA